MGTAAIVLAGRDEAAGARRFVVPAVWAALAYAAHPLAFALLVVLAGLACLCGVLTRSGRQAAALLALVPAGLLAVWDASRGAWLPIAGLTETTSEGGVLFRPIDMALVHVASRSYGIAGPAGLFLYLPHLGLLVAGTVGLAICGGGIRSRRLPLLGAAVFSIGSLSFPERVGMAVLLGPRVTTLGMCFADIAAAAWLTRLPASARRAAVLATALALAASAASVASEARLVESVAGKSPPRGLAGNFLAVQAGDCARAGSYYWGDWDPLRHAWAYALSPAGVAPFLFARHSYDIAWYRVERLQPYASEGRLLANERPLDPEACAHRNRDRVRVALASRGYDGVIVVGRPEDAESALEGSDAAAKERLAAGIWRLGP